MRVTWAGMKDVSAQTAAETQASLLAALGHGAGFNLVAASEADPVHGSLSVFRQLPNAVVVVLEVYEADDNGPNHPPYKRPVIIPTESDVLAKLKAWANE